MRGQELSLHENRQWVWGEQYVLGALVLQKQQLYYGHGVKWSGCFFT